MKIATLISYATLGDVVGKLLEMQGHHIVSRESPPPPDGLCSGVDLVIVESDLLYMPAGIHLMRQIQKSFPSIPILLLVKGDLPDPVKQSFSNLELLLMPFNFSELKSAIAHTRLQTLSRPPSSE